MRRYSVIACALTWCLVIGLTSISVGMKAPVKYFGAPPTLDRGPRLSGPFVILQQGPGDTSWVTPHKTGDCCPGDPDGTHGGEATGQPTGPETWCFENPVGPGMMGPMADSSVTDTCGCNPPWDVLCFDHIDVRGLASQMGINFWHVDDYMGVNGGETYNGDYCLWCGSDSLWIDSFPVECGLWPPGIFPGYGNQWNCVVQLDLAFTTSGTCTLAFDPRYDTECKYDYFYVDYYDGSEWQVLALFNGSSNSGYATCGYAGKANPDYYGFGDTGQPGSADWVTRIVSGQPAFLVEIPGEDMPDNPSFRWRVTSDGAWSDADGLGDTDGAAMIDNVLVKVDGNVYSEDFEDGEWDTLANRGWSLPDPDLIAQCWHQFEDPDPPYEEDDGESRTTCDVDLSIVWRGRPINGYEPGAKWSNGWFYRLMSPAIPITNTGCVFQYDIYVCTMDNTCDYMDTKVRFHSSKYGRWCTWYNIDGFFFRGGCNEWLINFNEDVTPFYNADYDSVMLCWDLMDLSCPGDWCEGVHTSTDFLMDNLSVGFYDGEGTVYRARVTDMFQDSFHDSICGFNSFFDTYDQDTLATYAVPGGAPLPKRKQLYVTIDDKDSIQEVRLYGSIDRGDTWVYTTMTVDQPSDPYDPELGGDYYGTLCPSDFSLSEWDQGTEVWYYVRTEDDLSNLVYWPGAADPSHPEHTGTVADYFTFSILPTYPDTYEATKILLVDGDGGDAYDYAACMAASDNIVPLEDIYEQTLADAGYCYDKYDIGGAGSNQHIHPIEFADYYDCIVWFTGPEHSTGLFDAEAQVAIRSYLNSGGKVVLCGDRIAYNMAVVGEDSLGGEFLSGIMGCQYQEEMEGPFDKRFVYLEAAASVTVFGGSVPIDMDSLVVYRECPYLQDMSYVLASASPDTGYTAQSLLYVLNPAVTADPADGAIYVEKPIEGGQCVYINYDLSGWVTHQATECDGTVFGESDGDFLQGYYYGRVDLMRTILEDLFGLTPPFPGGGGGTSDTPKKIQFRWALGQNTPNPVTTTTEIRFGVARTSKVSIRVYNAMGQLVRMLKNEQMQPGRYSITWDTTNNAGEKISSGVYFYTMEAGDFSATRKVLILR